MADPPKVRFHTLLHSSLDKHTHSQRALAARAHGTSSHAIWAFLAEIHTITRWCQAAGAQIRVAP